LLMSGAVGAGPSGWSQVPERRHGSSWRHMPASRWRRDTAPALSAKLRATSARC
jgi:hypothetical protein